MADPYGATEVREPDMIVDPKVLEFGGLRFKLYYTERGGTIRTYGQVDDGWVEMIRWDDFVDSPHYHVPEEGPQIPFDRASLGEPLAWYVIQIRDHLPKYVEQAGYAEVLPTIDMKVVAEKAEKISETLIAMTPENYHRVPGVGLQRVG
jgi:hypothetical protein